MTHYQTLGVPFDATDEEIRKAFQAKAKLCHPDVNTPITVGEMDFEDLSAAYSVLKNYETRRDYDRQVIALAKDCEHCDGTGSIVTMRGFTMRETACSACVGKGKVL